MKTSVNGKNILFLPIVLGTCVLLKNRIFVLGGANNRLNNLSNGIRVYDATNSWTELLFGQSQCTVATLLSKDELFVEDIQQEITWKLNKQGHIPYLNNSQYHAVKISIGVLWPSTFYSYYSTVYEH